MKILVPTDFSDNFKSAVLFVQAKYEHIQPIFLPTNLASSLIERLTKFIKKEKPGLIVLFLPSKSAEFTYSTKVSTLIFPK